MSCTSYITFNGISEDTYNLEIINIVRRVLPSVNNRLGSINNSDGSYYFGANLGNRQIDVTFQLARESSKEDIHTLITQIAGWLLPEDREAKILTINDEPGLYYIAQIDGSTDIEELFLYATFTVSFICTNPYKYSTIDTNAILSNYYRTTEGLDANFDTIEANKPRYGYGGVMIESTAENEIHNGSFTDPTSGVPDDYSIKGGSDTNNASITTTDGVVTLTKTSNWLNTTSFYGMVETPGSQHFTDSTTSKWSVGVWYRTTGDAKFRIRADFLDSGFNPLTSLFSTAEASTEWKYLKWENNNQTNQYVIGIGFELYADGDVSNIGSVEFKYANFEQEEFVHESIKTVDTTAVITNADALNITNNEDILDTSSNEYGIGITFKPFFNYNDDAITAYSNDRTIFELYEDSNNFLRVYIEGTTGRLTYLYTLNGTPYTDYYLILFDRLEEVKVYIVRDSNGIKLVVYFNSTTYSTSYVSLPSDDADYNKFYIGNSLQTDYAEMVLYDFVCESTPDSSNYFTGTITNHKFLTTDRIDNISPVETTKQEPIITITFTGSVVTLKILEEISGDYMYLVDSYSSGDILEIDTVNRTIKKNGSSVITTLDYANSKWIKLSSTGYSLLLDTLNADTQVTYTGKYI